MEASISDPWIHSVNMRNVIIRNVLLLEIKWHILTSYVNVTISVFIYQRVKNRKKYFPQRKLSNYDREFL